jgi:hypothetical protein
MAIVKVDTLKLENSNLNVDWSELSAQSSAYVYGGLEPITVAVFGMGLATGLALANIEAGARRTRNGEEAIRQGTSSTNHD